MLTSFLEKLKTIDDIYYIYAAIVFIMIVVYIIFVVVNNRFNKRDLISKEKEAVRDIYILEILFNDDKARIYSKKEYKKLYTYSIEQLYDLVQYSDVDDLKEWIEDIQNGVIKGDSHIIVRIINPSNSKISILRINFEQYNKSNNSLYCNFEIVHVEQKTNSLSVPSLINPNEFKNKLIDCVNNKKEPVGVFMIFELTTIKSIKKRYGNHSSNECLFEMMRRFKDLIDSSSYVSYFGTNSFYVYKNGIKNKEDAIEYMMHIYEQVGKEEISVNKYEIMPHFNVGISIYGEYTFDINELIRNTKLALLQGNNKVDKIKYGYYDYNNESINIRYRQNGEKLRQLIDGEIETLYCEPLVSLVSLSVYGFYARFDYSFTEENGYLTYLQVSKSLNLKDDFITKFIMAILNKCHNEMPKRTRIFIKVNAEDLELVKNIILSNNDYINLKIVLVIDYEQVIKEDIANIVKRVFEELSHSATVDLALIADENMITVYSSVLSFTKYIILDEFMISNVEVDDLKKITLENIIENTSSFSEVQILARGVKKYEQAQTLQQMGVIALSGPYVQDPTTDLKDKNFLKNRTIQRLYEHE